VVLGLPVNVVISIIVPIVGAPVSREGIFKGVRAGRVGVVRRDRASTVCAASDMRDGALVPFVSPGIAEATEEPFVALLGVMADLVTGVAARPGPLILGALGADVATVPTHGAEGVHVDDGRGSRSSGGRNGGRGVDSGVGVEGGRSGRGGTDRRSGVE
jgi:hypothetical protein